MTDWVAMAGLIGLGLAEVPQVMANFLPSPTTAMLDGTPERIASLKFDLKLGSVCAVGIALAVTIVARRDLGESAWLVFAGALAILGVFILRYNHQLRIAEARGGKLGEGY